jgi:ribosome-associated translation inhibitor RaiA
MATKHKTWLHLNIGKGNVTWGRDSDKGFFTTYKVTFNPSLEQIGKMTGFAETLIRDRKLTANLITIDTTKVALNTDVTFTLRGNYIYDEESGTKMYKAISTIGEEIEKRFFSKAPGSLRVA